jgi:quinoprotein glucose dehydrogenase
LVKETQQLIASDWTRKSPADLAKLLGHADWRVRLEAQFTLAERGAASISTLAGVATKTQSTPFARRHAVWGLGQLAAKNPEALTSVRTLAGDRDSEIRAQAIKVMGDATATKSMASERSAAFADTFLAGLKDQNNRVKFFAAQGLGKLSANRPDVAERAGPALVAALKANNNDDAYLRHAIIVALAAGRHLPTLTAAITDSSPAVRLGSLLALRRMKSPEVAKFLADSDSYIVREAAIAINDAPIDAAMPALAALINGAATRSSRMSTDEPFLFRVINANFRLGQPEHASALAAFAARSDAPARLRAEAIAQLALWPKPPQRDRLVGIYRPLPVKTRDRDIAVKALQPILPALLAANTPSIVQTAALNALQELEIGGATDALFATVRNGELPGATRAAALNALNKIKDPRLAEAVKFAGESSSSTLRLAALPIAARISPATAAPVLSNLVSQGSAQEQKAAFRSLSYLRHPIADKLILQQLNDLADDKVNPAVQLELINAATVRARSNSQIKALLAKRDDAHAASEDPLAPFRVALAGGDKTRGERIFRNQPTLACIRCHRAGADGGDAGPNLAGTGASNSREYLLESIIKPNAKIAPGFDTIVVTLKNGTAAAGVVAGETPDTLTLRNTDNKLVDVKKGDIAKREGAPSGMPEIYGSILTKIQLRDVVEYMASLTEIAPSLDENKPRALRGLPPPPKTTE